MGAFSPSVGLTVGVTSRLDLYGNLSTSFETPTTSELANQESGAGGFNPSLEPQRARSAEAGLNGRINSQFVAGTFQVAGYRSRVTDALIPFEVASVPGRQFFRNAGSTRHRGIESAASLALPARVMLRASFTHTEAVFDEYAVTSGGTTRVFDGKRVPGVAANRADATLTFQPSWLMIDADVRASSSIPVDDANTDRSSGYVLWGLRLGTRPVGLGRGGATLAPHLGVMNLFDREYNTSVVVNAFGGRYFEPGPGRGVYGGARVSF
jgi:iron complex outermembrane recepter protein